MGKRTIREFDGEVQWADESESWTVKSADGKEQDIANSLSRHDCERVHVRVEVTPVSASGWRWTKANADGITYYNGRIVKSGSEPVCGEVYLDAAGVWKWRTFVEFQREIDCGVESSKAKAKRAAEKAWAERVGR